MSLSSIDEYSDTHHPLSLYMYCAEDERNIHIWRLSTAQWADYYLCHSTWMVHDEPQHFICCCLFSPSECNFRYEFLCHLAAPSGWETWTVCLLFSTELLFYFSMKTNCVFAVQRWTGARVSAKKQPNGIKVNECKHTQSSLGSKKRLFQSQKLSELES